LFSVSRLAVLDRMIIFARASCCLLREEGEVNSSINNPSLLFGFKKRAFHLTQKEDVKTVAIVS
jgi:hypothetical protein